MPQGVTPLLFRSGYGLRITDYGFPVCAGRAVHRSLACGHRVKRHRRTGIPWLLRCSLTWRTVRVPKWKTEAARTLVAWPSRTAAAMCSTLPQPPDAVTGMDTASATAVGIGM